MVITRKEVVVVVGLFCGLVLGVSSFGTVEISRVSLWTKMASTCFTGESLREETLLSRRKRAFAKMTTTMMITLIMVEIIDERMSLFKKSHFSGENLQLLT